MKTQTENLFVLGLVVVAILSVFNQSSQAEPVVVCEEARCAYQIVLATTDEYTRHAADDMVQLVQTLCGAELPIIETIPDDMGLYVYLTNSPVMPAGFWAIRPYGHEIHLKGGAHGIVTAVQGLAEWWGSTPQAGNPFGVPDSASPTVLLLPTEPIAGRPVVPAPTASLWYSGQPEALAPLRQCLRWVAWQQWTELYVVTDQPLQSEFEAEAYMRGINLTVVAPDKAHSLLEATSDCAATLPSATSVCLLVEQQCYCCDPMDGNCTP